MNFNSVGSIKGVCSAALLSGAVIFSVLVTQPQKVDKTPVTDNAGKPPVAVQPRNYEPREPVSSRSDKPAKPATDFVYTVQAGDTLFDLAAKYGVTVDQIMAANGLGSDKLSLEQKLLIPASGKVKPLKPVSPPAAKPVLAIKKAANTTVSRARYKGRAVGEPVKWSEARNIMAIGDVATVIDVNTGYTFKIKRKGGHNHADCEPLTSADTAVMKKIYGSWSWNRRAIVVEISGKKIAASMAGMPHGSSNIAGNGFNGHFDIHFLGSMTHGSEYTKSRTPMVDPDHQAMVREAAGL